MNGPRELIRTAVERAVSNVAPGVRVPVQVEVPADPRNGDYSSNVALRLGAQLGRPPLEVAQELATKLALPLASGASVAAPGFLNLAVDTAWLARRIREIARDPTMLLPAKPKKRERYLLEFLSANPTGPLHLGNGRGGFMGDVLANVLDAIGHFVRREYYINDTGTQVELLAESVTRRYFQAHGINIPYPESMYQGEYIKDLAARVNFGKLKLGNLETAKRRIAKQAVNAMVKDIQGQVKRTFGIHFDRWFRQSELERSGLLDTVLKKLVAMEHTYQGEGALWLRTSAFGDDKDRVLVKSNGQKTYYVSDIAYHYDKLVRRRFDRAVEFLGADHHGYVGRLKASVTIFDKGRLDVVLLQLVRLIEGGKEVRMSKRSGTFVTLGEVVDEVGLDVTRYLFLSRAADTHLDFDLDVAKQQSMDNPVYYVQYAHARACSILAKVEALRRNARTSSAKPGWDGSERALALTVVRFPEVLLDVVSDYGVHRLTTYAASLARAFHYFYGTRRVIENDVEVVEYRRELVVAARATLARTLGLMGITAPREMPKLGAVPEGETTA